MSKSEALDLTMTQLRVSPSKSRGEIEDIRGCHAIFSFLLGNYINQLNMVWDDVRYESNVSYHRVSALEHTS